MKKVFSLRFLVALMLIASLFCTVFLTACFFNKSEDKDTENEVEEQGDSRVFKFAEYVGTVSNPGIGYTTTDAYHTSVGGTLVHDKQGDIVLFFVDLSPFSAGANADGKDYDLDEQFFKALRATFENCRNNGSTIALRFRYDENGKTNPEPNSFEQVLKHISQIKNSGVLEEYKDILMFVESGFVGQWGEQHSGKYTTVEYKAQLLEAMLDCVPSPVPVTVRTPDIFAKYVGIERNKLAEYVAEEGSDASRVGLYNDGYMGSNSDLGTYSNREIETQWLGNQTLTSYFGGEFSGNIDFAMQYDTYLPENCIPEMYKTHLSYINGNIFQLYKDYKFDKKYDVEGYDNSAYYGQTVFDFIRDHLGYRFVLQESTLPKEVAQGNKLNFSFTVVNNGFANPVKEQKCEIILEKDGKFVTSEVAVNPTEWYSGTTQKTQLNLQLPAFLEEGEWRVYFKSSIGVDGLNQFNFRSIRFASKDVWNETLGANYLGFIDVTASDSTVNTFGEVGTTLKQAHLYDLGGKVVVDGEISDGEWTEQDVIAKTEQYKLYAKADEEFLYVMADIPHNAEAPVFNLHATNADTGTSYWLYQQSSGFIYFDHDGETGHSGMLLKYSGSLFEFKIPFFMLGINAGTNFSEISVSVQDSGNGWKSTGSIKTTENYTVVPDFKLFNSAETLSVAYGGTYEIVLEAEADIADVVWFVDGVEVKNQNSAQFKLENIQSDCTVTASITSINGTVKKAVIANINVR